MPFIREPTETTYSLRFVRSDAIGVNDRSLAHSFYLSPDALVEDWRPRTLSDLQAGDLSGPLALEPEVILLGTGDRQQFPSTVILAACLTRGVGIEVMDNAAAARTFSVLANEGRRVVAAFLLSS